MAWIALMAGVGCSSSDSAGKLNDADFANLNLGNVLQIQGILPADWIFVPQQAIPTKSITNFLPAGARDHVGGIGAVSFRKVNGDQIVVSGGVVVAWLNKDFNAPDAKKQAVELGGSGAVPDVRVGDTPVAKTLSWSTRTAEGRNDDVIQFVAGGRVVVKVDIAYDPQTVSEVTALQLAEEVYRRAATQLPKLPPLPASTPGAGAASPAQTP